ncbi:MAG: glycosyltransferase family 4 protein [Proteobacteria bacterium]|nr:glycosyltransferase family 4 protein [Pseudomonadota bacterium]
MRIGYLVPEFPGQTHIFFWRELNVLRQLGADLLLISTSRPQTLSRHAFAQEAIKETHYLFPPRWLSAALYLIFRPRLSFLMLAYVLGLKESDWRKKLRLIGLMLIAAELLQLAAKEGLSHVHGHSCADVAHLLALAALQPGFSYSLTLHGDLPVYGTDHRSKFLRAKFISCVTFALQKQVMEHCGISKERLPVIRMGVDTDRFKLRPADEALHKGLYLITVARLAQCKGHIYVLKAMRRLLDQGLQLDYRIVGEGEEREAIQTAIQNLNLQNHVHLLGTASEQEVLQFLYKADCFILPSVGMGEAAPVSVMEAMACGLPVIASIIGGTPEMIQPMVNGILVEQADVDGLAKAIQSVSQDPSLRKKLGQEARKTAVEEFSAIKFAEKLYQSIKGHGSL